MARPLEGLWSHCLIHFYVYKGPDPTVIVDTTDSNGRIQYFEWYRGDNDGTPNYTSTEPQITKYFVENEATKLTVRGRDDDDIWSEDMQFFIYPDQAPPAPTLFVGTDPEPDSLVFKWGKKLDVHDSLQTKVQIAYCSGDDCTPSDSVYASGSEPTIAEIEAKWGTGMIGATTANIVKFKKPAAMPSGASGRWRVILIDERGSRTACESGCPATFVAP